MTSELTDQAVNQWIGKKLGYRFAEAFHDFYRPDNWWLGKAESFGEALVRYKIDFVNDPAMTLMLLEQSRLSVIALDSTTWMCGHQWMNGTVTMYANAVKSRQLGRAVAEAWMLANGYKP